MKSCQLMKVMILKSLYGQIIMTKYNISIQKLKLALGQNVNPLHTEIISCLNYLENEIDGLNDTIDYLRNEVANLEEEMVCLKLADLYDPNDR
jgi:predicted nuclease with TOPRIM domain